MFVRYNIISFKCAKVIVLGMIAILLLLVIIILLLSESGVYSKCTSTVSSREISALEFLYNSTNGQNWRWHSPVGQWEFSGSVNPCNPLWQGLTCDNHAPCTVVDIALSEYDLRGTIPPQISWLPNLTSLDFSKNRLEQDIPSSIGELSQLSWINLRLNELTGTIPEEIELLNGVLAYFDLSDNILLGGTFPTVLCELTSLTLLNVMYNHMCVLRR